MENYLSEQIIECKYQEDLKTSQDFFGEEKEFDEYEMKKNIQELINIQKNIQLMSKHNQIEILKILQSNKNIILNENKYGVFVNLTEINQETINKLKDFIEYIDTQEKNFIQIENTKNVYKNKFFTH
jgi:paraquat-inducible protein B